MRASTSRGKLAQSPTAHRILTARVALPIHGRHHAIEDADTQPNALAAHTTAGKPRHQPAPRQAQNGMSP